MNVLLYVDATSGGIVLQVLLSGLVGGLVFFKLVWRNLVNTILRRSDDTPAPEAEDRSEITNPASR